MKHTHHIYSIVVVIFFFSLLSFVMVNVMFHFYTTPKIFLLEKRFARERPPLDPGTLDASPRQYTPYFNDYFPYRTDLIGFYAMARFRYFHLTPYPDQVEIGRDGWMFFKTERPFYDNTLQLPDSTVEKVFAGIHNRAAYYHKKGIKFYLAIPPIKMDIYPEYALRNYVKKPGSSFTEKVINLLKKDTLIRLVDLKSAMLAAKKYGQLYYKTDNHWNALGGYWGYRSVMECMKKDFPMLVPIDTCDFTMEKKTIKGKNLAEIMYLSNYVSDEELVPHMKKSRVREGKKQGYKPRPGFGYPAEFEVVCQVNDSSLPLLVIVRDSYFYGMMPYIIENFRKTVILYDTGVYGIFDDAIRNERPNLVLYMIYESHLPDIVGTNM
jgi:alginate O-acetyltransferase complex protein AlgJ